MRTRSLGRVSREEPWAESSVRDPLKQRPAHNQDTGSASELEKETGWQKGDEWLPSNQGRTQSIWRAEVQLTPDLRFHIRRWTTLLCLPCPQQTWFLRGPCGAPRHGEGTFPFRDLTVTSMNAPSGQTDRKDGWWHAVVRT